jgi:signal transduction histidine kinase
MTHARHKQAAPRKRARSPVRGKEAPEERSKRQNGHSVDHVSPRNGQNPSATVTNPPPALDQANLRPVAQADLRPAAQTDLRPAAIDDCGGDPPCTHALEARQQTILQVRHELRTPLAALRSFLELATEDDLDSSVVHDCLEAIDRNVLRLSEALDRISVGTMKPSATPFRVDPTHLRHPKPTE